MKYSLHRTAYILIALIAALVIAFVGTMAPIPQDLNYHIFADTREFLSIPNALNVISNLPFLFVGLLGLYYMAKSKNDMPFIINSNRWGYFSIFLGTALVGLGSGYYHLSPNNQTLVWDRLPMTIAFMGLYSVIISEFLNERVGKIFLIPLLVAGIFSVLYWWVTEIKTVGDLRPYVVVQFFPILTIPILLTCFKSKYNLTSYYWWLLLTYILAKLFEHFDSQIYETISLVSGHSIKHILPAIGLYLLLYSYKNRIRT